MLPRGCAPLLLLALLAFIAAPLDAQMAAIGPVRWLWLEPLGRYILGGLVAGFFGVMLGYNAVWNALAYSIYLDDVKKAQDTYQRRKR